MGMKARSNKRRIRDLVSAEEVLQEALHTLQNASVDDHDEITEAHVYAKDAERYLRRLRFGR